MGRPYRHARRRDPAPVLEDVFDSRRNSLSLIRLVFAGLVLLDHAFPLGGFNGGTDPMWSWTRGQEDLGGTAVLGFFVVSGFLVTRSFDGSPNPISYIWKRFLRIFPGFWVCLLVTAVVAAPLAFFYEHHTLHHYVRGYPSDSPANYVLHNSYLNMNQYGINGLLMHIPWPGAFDGSLWTLEYEFKCYLLVMLLGTIGLFRRRRISVLILSLGLYALQIKQHLDPTFLQGHLFGDANLIRLAFIFSLGMLAYLYRDKIPITNLLAVAALVVYLVGMRVGWYYEAGEIAWAYLVMWAAVRLPFHQVDKYGDFSYGLYIYAFIVEQMLSEYHVNSWGYVPYVLMATAITMPIAVASWYLVERPCLKLKRVRIGRFRSVESAGDPGARNEPPPPIESEASLEPVPRDVWEQGRGEPDVTSSLPGPVSAGDRTTTPS